MTVGTKDEVKSIAKDSSVMATEVRRDNFKNFWNKFSDKPDTNTMMLNNSAEDLEAADRADILSALPKLHNKDVVDIGAGIGRFTTILAETAKSVLSTDFIESFITKNQERNGHMANVDYRVGDAVHLKMDPTSVDLVFTNWLMMYLSDSETIEFMFNCMKWLRPNGFVHLRESCSEPSTGRKKTNTMHNAAETNPTHYRFSSLYIMLLRNIRFEDSEGKVWKFHLEWSCSVPTYIQTQNNWRQVHWLAKKVAAEGDKPTSQQELLQLISKTWYEEQLKWDEELDNEKYVWTDKIFSHSLSSDFISKNSTVLAFTPRSTSPFVHVNAHLLSEKFTCNVWNVETEPYYFRTSLTKANTLKDKRVRFSWNDSLSATVDYWSVRDGSFETFIATELLATTTTEQRKGLKSIMNSESMLVLLEPVTTIDEEDIKKNISDMGAKLGSMSDVTEECKSAQSQYLKDHNKSCEVADLKWVLIQGRF